MRAAQWGRLALLVVGLVVLLQFGIAALEEYPISLPLAFWLHETETIRVKTDERGQCVFEQTPKKPIVTRWDHTVTWKIDGQCPEGYTVGVEGFELFFADKTQDPIESKLEEREAKPGTKPITLTVKKEGATPKGLYVYRIVIKKAGAPGAAVDPRDFFALCPEWPCKPRK